MINKYTIFNIKDHPYLVIDIKTSNAAAKKLSKVKFPK